MDYLTIVMLIVGLVLLVMGAELLVRGATRIAALAGIPPLIVGLTVVSFGTSAPELAVRVDEVSHVADGAAPAAAIVVA